MARSTTCGSCSAPEARTIAARPGHKLLHTVTPTDGRYKWWVVAMLWTICFFNYADRQAIFSVFPLLEREMHLTPVQLGLLGSAFAWVYGLAAPAGGAGRGSRPPEDRDPRRPATRGASSAWRRWSRAPFRHLFLFRAAEGLGETFYFPASMSMHRRLSRPRSRDRGRWAASDQRLRRHDRAAVSSPA